jgi:hypothetical protein
MYRQLDGILLNSKEKHIEYFEECKIKHVHWFTFLIFKV